MAETAQDIKIVFVLEKLLAVALRQRDISVPEIRPSKPSAQIFR